MSDNYRALPDGGNDQPSSQQKFAQYKTTMDKGLDVVINKIDIIKNKANTVGTTLEQHDAMLENANNKLQKNNRQLKTLNEKMEDFLESTSNCCLYIAIAVSGFIFLLLVSI